MEGSKNLWHWSHRLGLCLISMRKMYDFTGGGYEWLETYSSESLPIFFNLPLKSMYIYHMYTHIYFNDSSCAKHMSVVNCGLLYKIVHHTPKVLKRTLMYSQYSFCIVQRKQTFIFFSLIAFPPWGPAIMLAKALCAGNSRFTIL